MQVEHVIFILLIHFLADFAMQTPWQAENKWWSADALCLHVLVYSAIWWIASGIYLGWGWGLVFACITFITHLCIDYWTSRINHEFFEKKDWHNGWVGVGFDQLLHCIQLILTFNFLYEQV